MSSSTGRETWDKFHNPDSNDAFLMSSVISHQYSVQYSNFEQCKLLGVPLVPDTGIHVYTQYLESGPKKLFAIVKALQTTDFVTLEKTDGIFSDGDIVFYWHDSNFTYFKISMFPMPLE